MAGGVSIQSKRKEVVAWVFSWKPLGRPISARWLPFFLVSGVFALMLAYLHVQVIPPKPWSALKASMIHAGDDGQGVTLALRAREGGPFPSRCEPQFWSGAAALEQVLAAVGHPEPAPYLPELRGLDHVALPSKVSLAAEAQPMWPKRVPAEPSESSAPMLKPTPVIYPLSAALGVQMVGDPPPFTAAVDAAMVAESWRFLMQLDALGNVLECVSLAGGDQPGLPTLTAWLRMISFKPDSKKTSRWIAVGVGFTNQVANEPDPR
jgi:hypothetical protein